MTIGPDGKPKVREFGNARSLFGAREIPGATGAAATSTAGKPLTAGENRTFVRYNNNKQRSQGSS
jgi:hypothetical protein